MTVVAVFRSRSQAIDFVNKLSAYGVSVQTVNTPVEAKVGCGLSAKFERVALAQAKNVVRQSRYSAFVGFFMMNSAYGRNTLLPV